MTVNILKHTVFPLIFVLFKDINLRITYYAFLKTDITWLGLNLEKFQTSQAHILWSQI